MQFQHPTIETVMNELDAIKQMIHKLQETPSKHSSLSDELWTVQMVADYLHKTKATIQSHYQDKPGFPRSKKIGATRYYVPAEVIAYAKRPKAH